jgi:hypothetical protein
MVGVFGVSPSAVAAMGRPYANRQRAGVRLTADPPDGPGAGHRRAGRPVIRAAGTVIDLLKRCGDAAR